MCLTDYLLIYDHLCGIFSPAILPILKENYEVTEKCYDPNQVRLAFLEFCFSEDLWKLVKTFLLESVI